MKNITRRSAISIAAAGAASSAFAAVPLSAEASMGKHAWMARESIHDLAIYYEACWAAADGLTSLYNQPRCDENSVVGKLIDEAKDPFFEDIEAVKDHVLTRQPDSRHEAYWRRRVLLHWYSEAEDPEGEIALARELLATRGQEA